MWKAAVGNKVDLKDPNEGDDDWDTDPDFINDVTEQEQRWGSRTVEGSGRNAGSIDMAQLRKETEESDANRKKKEMDEGPNAAFGYGGKFGVQADRMDKSAMGHDYIAKVEKHVSQTDYSSGFGGKYGVQTDRIDKSAVTWDHKEKVVKHSSQKDYSTGFGGKFGVQADRQDQSAVGWDHVEQMHKHESQKDYSVGFGGKFGVQSDRQDKCAVGWDHHEAPQKHESQTDHKIGFGGKFGVQKDRMDKSASSFNEEPERVGTTYTKAKPDIGTVKPSALRAKFEKMSEDNQNQANEPAKPSPKHLVQAKSALFNQPKQEDFKKPVESSPKQLDQSKTGMFTKQISQPEPETVEHIPKPLDQSKMTAFTSQRNETEEALVGNQAPKQLDMSKIAMFSKAQSSEPVIVSASSKQLQQELEELKQQKRFEDSDEEEIRVPPKTEEKKVPVSQIQEPMPTPVQPIQQAQPVQPAQPVQIPVVPQQMPSSSTAEEQISNVEKYAEQDDTEITLEDTGLTAIALYDYQAAADDEISFDPDDVITHVEMIDEGWWRGLCRNQYGLFPANYVQMQQ